ncbi:MAG TPA: polysaccharide lyase family protein [Verrucomicrobiae bacterium]|jgi:rhamnogalacturonan endolyase
MRLQFYSARIIAVLFVLGICATSRAQTTATWTGPASGGEWNTAVDWSTARVPGAATNVVIGPNTNVSYNLPMAASTFGILTNKGVLNVNTSGFNNTGIIMLNPGGTGQFNVNASGAATVTGNLAFCSNSIVTMAAGSSLTVNGSLWVGSGTNGGSSSAGPGSFGTMTNNGGTLRANSTGINPGNGSVSTSALLVINGGTNNLGTVSVKRSSGTSAFPNPGLDGLAIYGGIVTMTNLNVGGSGGNSYLSTLIAGGTVTNIGNVLVNQVTGGRGSRLLQTGGLFVIPDPAIINPNPSASGSLNIVSITGGTNITGGLIFGSGSGAGSVYFTNQASVYVGSQGISSNGVVALSASLNNGGLFGATANWTGSAAMILSGGTFTFSPVDLNGNPHTITLTGALSGSGGLLVINGGTLALDAANSYAGNTTVAQGLLVLGNSSGLPTGGSLTIGGSGTVGTFDLAGFSPQLGALATAGTAANQIITNSSAANAATLIFSNSAMASTFGGIIAGGSRPITISVLGGNLMLNAQNNYAGNLLISGGTLALSGAGSTFTGPAIVLSNSASVLDLTGMNNFALGSGQSLSGYGSVTGNVSAANCQITPGSSSSGGTLTITGNLSLNGGATNLFNLQFNPNTAGSGQIIVIGALNLSGLNTLIINPLNNTLSAGTYQLIQSGSVGSGSAANFQVVIPSGLGLQAVVNVTATGVDLVITQVAEQITWKGDGAANLWDQVSSNWLSGSTPTAFANGDDVTFDDASTNITVNLSGIVQPAFVTVNSATNYTFAGNGSLSGTVTLTKTNSGILIVLTTNTFNGAATIGAGTLQLGNGVASGTMGTALIVDNSQLLTWLPDGSVLSNAVSGTGSLIQASSGTLTLVGNNSYSGNTVISNGTLQVGNGGSVGTGNVIDDTALVFDDATTTNVVEGAISGGGSLTILGGTVALTGNSTYSGGTIVSNSTLLVDNTTGSGTGSGAVTVLNGGTLGGTGIIGNSVIVQNGGALSPGNGTGTLAINGDLIANSGSLLNFSLGASSDEATVSGNLTLNGSLNIANAGGLGNGTYTLFTYGGILSGVPALGSAPSLGKVYLISTNTPGQVNLVVTNIPGIGAGPTVSLTDSANTVTLSNGIVSIVISKTDAHIPSMIYNGFNMLAGGSSGGEFYWSWNQPNFQNPVVTQYSVVQNPTNNGGTVAEVDLFCQWNGSGSDAALDVDIHYFLVQGSPGFYASAIISHPASYPDNPGGEFRMVGYLNPTFNWLSVDNYRSRLMPLASTASVAVTGAPKEFQLWTAGIQQGQYDCKYGYSADLCDENAWGWSSTANNIGLWMTVPSREYYNGGPMKRELMCHDDQGGVGPVLLQMVNGTHYTMGSDTDIKAGETFSKTFGPWLIYANSVAAGTTNAPAALFADAQARGQYEQSLWPYAWWTNVAYIPKAGRGTVTGAIKINDIDNPDALPAGLWVGVAQAPPSSENSADFQYWEKNLQFWIKTDANGNFTIPNIIAGTNYTLFAFGPGAIGTFQSQSLTGTSLTTLSIPSSPFNVTVVGGVTTNLGTITWTPPRTGPTVWEIGVPDRSAHEFLHGTGYETNGWWYGDIGSSPTQPSPNWMKSFDFANDFPSGLTYNVGQSQWSNDWNFAHTALGTNAASAETWKVFFNLPQAPANGATALLYLGFAADFQGPVKVLLNGNTVTSGITPPSGSDDTMIRLGIHGVFSDDRLSVPISDLHAGQNEMDFTMTATGSTEKSAMYDYVRLELSSYLPPAPAGVSAAVTNSQVSLDWATASGATSYTVERATSLNGTYTIIATNVFAPVVGGAITNGAYLDAAAPFGTNYYIVASVNPNGSTNSSPVNAVVVAPSQPQISNIQFVNGNFVISGGNGSAGRPYYILTSSNLTLPVSQWTPLLTNYFDNNGNFAGTNAIPPGAPQSFYLIQVP